MPCEHRHPVADVGDGVPMMWSSVTWRSWPSQSRNPQESPMCASADSWNQ